MIIFYGIRVKADDIVGPSPENPSDVPVEKVQRISMDQFVGPSGSKDYDLKNTNKAKHRPVSISEKFGYTVVAYYPWDINSTLSKSYVITDKIDKGVKVYPDTLKAYTMGGAVSSVKGCYVLTKGKDYTVSFDKVDNTLTFSITTSGLNLLGKRYTDHTETFIALKFDGKLLKDAKEGVSLYSHGSVSYTYNVAEEVQLYTSLMARGETEKASSIYRGAESPSMGTNTLKATVSQEPEVHTGQIEVIKYDSNNKSKRLSGAKFGIAGTKADASKNKFIETATTDGEGMLYFKGLKYGQLGDGSNKDSNHTVYWIKEIAAPKGYELNKTPIKVKTNIQKEKNGQYIIGKVNVYNKANTLTRIIDYVKTGDNAQIFIFIGLILIAMGVFCVSILSYKKRRN